jgi:hypothetical protein
MTTGSEERSVPADAVAPLPYAATFAHLRGASAAVVRLLAEVEPSDPIHDDLLEASEAIQVAHDALIRCVHGSRS